VVLVALASLVLGLAALLGLPIGAIGLRLYLMAVAAVVMAALVAELAEAIPPAPPSAFERVLRRRPALAPDRPVALVDLESLLAGRLSAGDVHFRLRPLLREVAASRLRTARGVDLDADPESARRLLGPAAWELVRPDRDAPDDRFAPGLELADLRPVIEALEAVT
jgi:hypothetical protein